MNQEVIINDLTIKAQNFSEDRLIKERKELHKIGFDFKVTSNDYHDVTKLLYENDFFVRIPGKGLEFPAIIYNYSTSITNLYEENAVGKFRLELIEKV